MQFDRGRRETPMAELLRFWFSNPRTDARKTFGGETGVMYVFDAAYLFNKDQIEASSGFDRAKYYNRIHDDMTAEGCRFRRDFYLDEYWADEGYCLYEEGEFWVVAFLDHGRRLSPAFFVHPEDAEMFFRAKLRAVLPEHQKNDWQPPVNWRPQK